MKTKKDFLSSNDYNKKQVHTNFCTEKFAEFCRRTDLHGYKYIVMENLSVFERCCWALAVLISMGFAAYFVITAYNWYARNPVITVIESTHGVIWEIPFPAVTICDLNVISRKAARAFANNLTLPSVNVTSDNIFDYIRLAPLLHSTFKVDQKQRQDLLKLQVVLDFNNVTIEALFTQLSPAASCSNLVQKCMWKNTIYRCDLLFEQVFTHFNLCCAFNYYATNNNGNKKSKISGKTPRRVASCGYQTALTVLLNTDPDDYYSASIASQGVLVLVDNAYNIPNLDSPARIVNPSTEVLIALSPETTYTTPGIKAFTPSSRECYYNDEVQINNFRQYSYHNCMAYKGIEILKSLCNCVPFYFPLKDDYRRCNFNDLDCLQRVLKPVENQIYDPNQDLNSSCLPECEHHDYPLEVALGLLAKNVKFTGLAFYNDIKLENHSILNVFFHDLISTRYRRDVYLNWQSILASFGGLMSLMLGFTLVAGIDLIIFFVFRVAYDLLKTTLSSVDMGKNNKEYRGNKINVQEIHNKSDRIEKLMKASQKNNKTWHHKIRY